MELEPNTRLFVVAGKHVDESLLTEAFRAYGTILGVKLVKEKGVAYINYDKASSAAMAIENLHETILNDGKGPMVKVMFAEAPKIGQGKRHGMGSSMSGEVKGVADPDNVPPQSRLFIVVPKTSDGSLIESEMASFDDLEYCKTDLIAAKGIVFCKYSKTSSALKALESVQQTGMLAGYKVKCMLAEPKGKRGRQEFSGYSDPSSPMYHAPNMTVDPVGMLNHAASLASNLSTGSYLGGYPVSPSHSAFSGASDARAPSLQSVWAPSYHQNYSARQALDMQAAHLWNSNPADTLSLSSMPSATAGEFGGLGSALNLDLAELQADAVAKGALNMDRHVEAAAVRGALHLERSQPLSNLEISALAQKVSKEGIGAFDFSAETMSKLTAPLAGDVAAPVPADLAVPLSGPTPAMPQAYRAQGNGRLTAVQVFAAVSKDASEQELRHLFGSVPGLEYCQMLPHQQTGMFEGLVSVGYSTPIAAINAIQKLSGHLLQGYPVKMLLPDDSPGRQHPAAARTSSIISDSNDAFVRRSSPLEDAPESRNRSPSFKDLGASQPLEVAVLQDSLSHLSMPQRPEEPQGPQYNPSRQLPNIRPRRQEAKYTDTEGEAESQSQAAEQPLSEEARRKTVYTLLKRPLPDYAIEHFFNTACGPVQLVRLHPGNACIGAVQFQTAEAADKALQNLGQAQICGLDLEVSRHNPIDSVRKKRARRGA